jgi:hypothetical protein
VVQVHYQLVGLHGFFIITVAIKNVTFWH